MNNIRKFFILLVTANFCLFGVDEEVQRKGRGWSDWYHTWTLSEKATGVGYALFSSDEWAPLEKSEKERAFETLDQTNVKIKEKKGELADVKSDIQTNKDLRDALKGSILKLRKKHKELKLELQPEITALETRKTQLATDKINVGEDEQAVKKRREILKEDEGFLGKNKEQFLKDKKELESKIRTEKDRLTIIKGNYKNKQERYQELMKGLNNAKQKYIPAAECEAVLAQFTYFAYDPLPVGRWLANISLSSFYESRLSTLFREHQNFIDINSMNHFDVWLEPFGLYSEWKQDEEEIRCKMQSIGFTMGGGVSLADQFSCGLGFGYWYTDLRSKDSNEFKGRFDTFVLGPYLAWNFGKGYFGAMLWGGWSDFSVNREGQFDEIPQRTENTHSGWSLAGRAELGYSFVVGNIATNPAFIKPYITLDYYSDFQEGYTEENGSTDAYGAIEIYKVENSRHCNFLSTKIALECKKEFHEHGKGFFIPSATIGWRYLQPLSCDDSDVKCFIAPDASASSDTKAVLGEAPHKVPHNSYASNSLIFLDGGLSYIARNGIATAMKIEVNVGSHYQVYGAEVRLEIGW